MTGKLKVLYFGTPQFAADLLRSIFDAFHIVGVVTRPDARKGRGMKMFPSEVALAAEELGIREVFKPKRLKNNLDFLSELPQFDCAVVASYGLIIPATVLNTTEYFVNVHASLLPEYRGAAPIERAIMDGKSETGISLMKMEEGLDTGGYWVNQSCPITDRTTFAELSEQLRLIASQLLCEYLPRIVAGSMALKQQGDEFTYARKISKEEQFIDWSQKAQKIVRQVNAIGGVAELVGGQTLKIIAAEQVERGGSLEVGSFDKIGIRCGEGFLAPKLVQPGGKKPMSFKDFLNGFKGQLKFKV